MVLSAASSVQVQSCIIDQNKQLKGGQNVVPGLQKGTYKTISRKVDYLALTVEVSVWPAACLLMWSRGYLLVK